MSDLNGVVEFLNKKNKDNKSVYYHSTFEDFESFDFTKSPFGMHFGTEESAKNRVNIKKRECERLGSFLKDNGENPKMIVVELDVKKPLNLGENRTGLWNPFDVIKAIMEIAEKEQLEGFTESDVDNYYEDAIEHNGVLLADLIDEDYGDEYNSTELKEHLFVRDWIESRGYDSIVYKNEFENGGDSIIAFREEQVKIIDKFNLNKKIEQKTKNNSCRKMKP